MAIEPTIWNFKHYSLLLVTLIFIVFANTLFNGYNFDDNLVTNNHPLTSKGLKSIWRIFSSSYYTNNADINFGYRPITHLSFAIEHQLFGEKPGVSHFINLLIYLVGVFGFFKILSNWFEPKALLWAFLAALIFGIHPIHSEAVASIKNRDELLAFVFLILSFIQLNKFVSHNNWRHILFAALFFAIGLLSKKSIYPMVFVMPLVLIYIKSLELKTSVIIGLLLAIVAGLLAADFIWQRMLLLMFTPILFLVLLVLYEKRSFIYNSLNTPVGLKIWELSLVCLSILFSAASIYLEDYLFFVLASIFMAILFVQHNYKSIYLILFSAQLLAVAYALDIKALSQIAFLLSSLAIIPLLKNKKFEPILFLNFILTLGFILIYKFKLGNLFLIFNMAIVVYFATKNKLICIGVMLFNLLVSFAFFRLNYFNLVIGITTFHLIWAYKLDAFLGRKFPTELLLLLFLVPIAFFADTQKTAFNNYVDGLKIDRVVAGEHIQISQSNINEGELSEGRSLSYVENTLIGNQTMEAKFTTGITTLGEYMRVLAFPHELLFYYGYAKVKTSSFSDANFWFWLVVLALLLAFVLFNMRGNKFLLIGFWWLLISLFLFSNWVELVAGMVGERLAFTASAGFCLLVVAAIMPYKPSLNFKKIGFWELGLMLVMLVFSARTIARNANWKSPLVLMEHDMEDLSESAYANHMYALTCMNELSKSHSKPQQEQFALLNQAEEAFIKSINIYPSYFNANFDLARLYIQKNEFGSAKKYLDNCYQLDSSNLFVLEELAKTCFDLKLTSETVRYANMFLSRFPQNENMYEILAYTLFIDKEYVAAKQAAELGLQYYPQSKNLRPLLLDIDKNIVLGKPE